MIDYIRGGSLGIAMLFLASHTSTTVVLGFFVVAVINFALSTSYFVRYFINK